MAMFIESFLEHENLYNENYTFIFIAPSIGQLDYQGFEKISKYLDDNWVKGFKTKHIGSINNKKKYLQNINFFEKNTIYFLGWGLFKKKSHLANINSEKNDIYRVLNKTKIKKNQIILIIDEAHRELNNIESETKKSILNYINAKKQINISATLDNPNYKITLKEVRQEAAIKKNVIINSLKDNDFTKVQTEVQFLLNSAILKQKIIRKKYWEKLKIKKVPLILIQIPDEKSKINNLNLELIEKFLISKNKKKDIHYTVWMHKIKRKMNKKDIINSKTLEFLIFKQSVATGWDIPRANILVKLRESKSSKFIIQTLGRILRNPFHKYYEDEYIDNAFVFTIDKKYSSKIKEEEIVISDEKLKKITLSLKGKKSNFQINKIFYKNEFDFMKLKKEIFNELNSNKDLITKLISKLKEKPKINNEYNILKNYKIKTDELDKEHKITMKLNIAQINYNQGNFNFNQIKDTLFGIYLKFKLIFVKDVLIFKITEELGDFLTKNTDIKLKNFYKYIINNLHSTLFENKSLFEWIEWYKNKVLKKKYKKNIKKEKFKFNDFIELKEEMIENNSWDKVNTYDFSLEYKKLDSNNEIEFYKSIKLLFSTKKFVHIFRNNVNNNNFYVEYFDKNYKKLKFYPDFLLINDKYKNVLIVEVKSKEDIDKNTDKKVEYMKLNINNISDSYKIFFLIIRNKKNNDLEFIDWKQENMDFSETINEFIEGKTKFIKNFK